MCMCAWSLQLCPVLCDLMDCSHPQDAPGRNTGLPYPPPRDLPDPGIEPGSLISPALAGGFFTTEPPGKPLDNLQRLFKALDSCREKYLEGMGCVFYLFCITGDTWLRHVLGCW